MKQDLETIFRNNLRVYRKRAKISQEKLSTMLDKNINYINMIEGGKSVPPLFMIERIAEILKISPSSLLEPIDKNKEFNKQKFIEEVSGLISEKTYEILEEKMINLN